ncbi:peptide chain release factor N(5)-glutamine methyltransferase [Kocuria sp. p3-SID1433]|uniref:peptide chain release factor N(5)-glutamine methyltransferase n=1 Tax=unclassified Kocuria TaxID=2649579 RepID=UPI0021A79969|nr:MULTISPECIES: peptide chain release factor N(5)-glutamine methyltransferase [unclassified Kocuria]MCT1601734.1 peptide chain release factor N(5)-glutamine methyltransferase [Kocuria sp. p3-SID1428]MCT2180084.1 peptide chain release factor N(5)-glutamine methyltransferase [Kocuria sp. p3-SID1433]
MAETLAQALRRATARLEEAGVPAAQADAVQLAGHLLGLDRGEVAARAILGTGAPEGLEELVARRAAREPLQHIVGTAPFRRLELQVGPGVFIPRPETELLVELLVERLREDLAQGQGRPVVVDLCTGSGAIAAAIADEVTHARVHAIELDPQALQWARRNLEGTRVDLREGDATKAPEDLRGRCAAVVSNPPYVPAREPITQPEVLIHDPAAALWGGGADGMDMPRRIIAAAAELLRPGGWCVLEHAESQAEDMQGQMRRAGFEQVQGHQDLAGRARATSGVLA